MRFVVLFQSHFRCLTFYFCGDIENKLKTNIYLANSVGLLLWVNTAGGMEITNSLNNKAASVNFSKVYDQHMWSLCLWLL